MQATLVSFITAFTVATAHGGRGGQPVGPRPGPGPVRPTPSGLPSGNPFGCPQGIAPELGSYCSQPTLACNYPSMGESYYCGRGRTWLATPPNPVLCYKDGHTYEDGYEFINIQGCVEWECENGQIEYNSCPPPSHGCYKDGKTYPNHYQPLPDAAGCVEWQCENGKIRYNPCPATDGCWRNGFYYTDGYTQYSDRHCAIWECSNGHIRYLGGCPVGPEEAKCRLNGHEIPVGVRVKNYKGPKLNCATAVCTKVTGFPGAKFQCLLG